MYFYHKENRILLVKKRGEEVLSRYLIVSAMADKQIRISAHGEYFEGGKNAIKKWRGSNCTQGREKRPF